PTMENYDVLQGLTELCEREDYVLAFDWEAYKITASKIASDRLFVEKGLPCPRYYPEGELPYIAKPDSESGSHGIRLFREKDKFEKFMEAESAGFIVQEFIEGPSYSVEIIGEPGNYRTYVPTEIFVDDIYDCNLAAVHRNIDRNKIAIINDQIRVTAEALKLKGIMDIEVIDRNGSGDIRILEVDARLPSQTSVAVFHASGMNYIEELYDLFCKGDFKKPQEDLGRCSSYTQYLFDNGKMSSQGEHIMVEGKGLEYSDDLCSEAKAVTDFAENRSVWRGIFINWADTKEQLHEKETLMVEELRGLLK
ncbi:MAG: ATP-grasp domain-containing protein, partial [Eubacteriales bacterium]|nr:ATP-grasp domain-containing protein [Eubacteriales bacterium]